MRNAAVGPWEQNRRTQLAASLLEIGAIEIRKDHPFTWSSGWKSPIYCDNRLLLGYPNLRSVVCEGFTSVLQEWLSRVNLIAGTATAGIAHAALVADKLQLPMCYVRGAAKGHGQQKRIEGKIDAGARAIVIEDTMSTGSSAFSAVEALRAADVDVLCVLTIFSYNFAKAKQRSIEANLPVIELLDYQTLIETAASRNYISQDDIHELLAWREDPEGYTASHKVSN